MSDDILNQEEMLTAKEILRMKELVEKEYITSDAAHEIVLIERKITESEHKVDGLKNEKERAKEKKKLKDLEKKKEEVKLEDWKENAPERYARHLIEKVNYHDELIVLAENKIKEAKTDEEKKKYEKEISQNEKIVEKIMDDNREWLDKNQETVDKVVNDIEEEKKKKDFSFGIKKLFVEENKIGIKEVVRDSNIGKNLSEDEKKDIISRAKLRIASKKEGKVEDDGCKMVELKPKYEKSAKLDKKQETRIVSMYTSNIETQKRA